MRRVALALLAAAVLATPAFAQDTGARGIVESQQRLEQIRRERAGLRQEMNRIRSRVSDLSTELTNVEQQVSTSSELLAELESQLVQRQTQIEETNADLETTREHLADRERILNLRLREIYKRGPLHTLQVLLAAESFSDLLNRYRYLLLVARYDRDLADEVSGLERQLVVRERTLRGYVTQLERLQRERAQEYQELSMLREQQSVALDNVQARERTAEERLAQLARDERSLEELLTSLEEDRTAPGSLGTAPAPAPIASLSPRSLGTLPWPTQGRLLYRFGAGPQPGNNASVRRSGIGIGGPAGAAVSSVAPGRVVLAGPFEGYGPSVIVSHGDGYYSLYLYLSAVQVREGTTVTAGQRLGSLGAGSVETGPMMEFQVRVPGGQAADPLTWLRPL